MYAKPQDNTVVFLLMDSWPLHAVHHANILRVTQFVLHLEGLAPLVNSLGERKADEVRYSNQNPWECLQGIRACLPVAIGLSPNMNERRFSLTSSFAIRICRIIILLSRRQLSALPSLGRMCCSSP